MGAAFASFRLRVPGHVFGEPRNAAINTPGLPARRFGTPDTFRTLPPRPSKNSPRFGWLVRSAKDRPPASA